MNNSLSVGSIIKCNDVLFLIIGLYYDDNSETISKKYSCVAYPYGYLDYDSIRVIDSDQIELVQTGYESDRTQIFKNYYVKAMDKLIDDNSIDDVRSIFKEVTKKIKEFSSNE